MKVLTQAQWDFWQDNGYIVVPDAVPKENVKALVDFMWAFTEMDRDDPETWYRPQEREYGMAELNQSGMIELYHHQTLWDNRQHPRIHGIFSDIWGTENLWVTIDRVNLNRPARPDWDFKGFVHWDIDTSLRPLPFDVQGVLSLVDTTADMGGLQVVPGFHRRFEEWVKTQPADRDPWKPNPEGLTLVPVEMNAGDLVIWHSMLPHGTGRNNSDRPRLAQYISMFPAKEDDESLRQERIRSWRERLPREGIAFTGDPRNWEVLHGTTAELTSLGHKLLGLDRWDVPASSA